MALNDPFWFSKQKLIKFLSVTVGNIKVCTSNPYDKYKGCYAFADSGHTLLSGVKSDINKINAQLGFALDGSIDCKKRATMPSNIIQLCCLRSVI